MALTEQDLRKIASLVKTEISASEKRLQTELSQTIVKSEATLREAMKKNTDILKIYMDVQFKTVNGHMEKLEQSTHQRLTHLERTLHFT